MRKRFLNVGGNSKAIAVPDRYRDWEHVVLDIDPTGKPDIVCDARELQSLKAEQFDAVYCSHNLEHFFAHDVQKVLAGFQHVLAPRGFAEIRVPDLGWLMKHVVEEELDIEDQLYVSPAGPVRVRDVIYGMASQIERSGVDFYAHKTGFTKKALTRALVQAGFVALEWLEPRQTEMAAIAYKRHPSDLAAKATG